MDPSKLEMFSTLKEVTGFINIQANHPGFTSLFAFRNLEIIGGRHLTEYFSALFIVKTSLKSLNLQSLQRIQSGAVVILENNDLCYAENINWQKIMISKQHNTLLENNKSPEQCIIEKKLCDGQCSSDSCLVITNSELEDGSTYCGEVKNGKPHGNGTLIDNLDSFTGTFVEGLKSGDFLVVFDDGGKFEGEYTDNKRNGNGTYFHPNGRKLYEGMWKNDVWHGKGVQYYYNGNKYEGDFYNGERHGEGVYYARGKISYEGGWKDDQRHGQGIFYYYNGGRYEGEWEDGRQNGNGVEYNKDDEKYEGQWKNGMKDGWGNHTYSKDQWKYYDGEWNSDVFNGYGKMVYTDGSVYNGYWKSSKRDGEGLFLWPNGTIFFGRMRKDVISQGIMSRTPWRHVLFAPFKNSVVNGNGYKVSNITGLMSCLSFNFNNEIERPCHKKEIVEIYHDNLDFYEGEALEQRREQLKHGFGEFHGIDGSYIIGNWKMDVLNGFGLQRIPWEPTLIGNFKDGVLEGVGVSISTTYTHGTMTIGRWFKGFMEGPGLFSYPNGDLVLGYFVKGRLDHDKNPLFIHSNGDISDTWFKVL